ncbi:methyltransferase domain-containing protein [Streptomyces piniterrae]|uniref:Methyltransferase domain-containing protein n=1 Tax=Streptomyces piniterrae TaxID=2571125 RepID=A0A4U0NRH7_9ACTN|nr:50S ribosomal protein L11 methyltransferase [Streptomyces piniterrae]TJZ57115.1 methyltransferase domain-containing protein [Streptomyces piniterrae]
MSISANSLTNGNTEFRDEEFTALDVDGSPGLRLALASLQTQAQELDRLVTATLDTMARPREQLSSHSTAFAEIATRSIPRWHFAMLNDTERNDALIVALERRIPAGAHVLDIGTGTGLLAMAAARAGAGRVVTCEENPLLAEIARQIIAQHGMSDVITVVNKRSTHLVMGSDLERPVDVIISEVVDCGLIGEGLLPTMRHAREHLLAPGGVLIPGAARLYGQLIQSEVASGLNRVGNAGGFDVSLMNVASTRGHFPVRLHTWPHDVLSGPVELLDFDLLTGPLAAGSRVVPVPATAAGPAHALVAWFELDLGSGVVLRNSPDNVGSHWMQALIPFDKPAMVGPGDRLDVELHWTDYSLSAR